MEKDRGFTNGMASSVGNKQGMINGNSQSGLTNGVGGKPEGRTNGMTNGLTNGNSQSGLTNGVGGSGLTNGMTNGMTNGLTNGQKGNYDFPKLNKLPRKKGSWRSILIIFIVISLISLSFITYSHDDYDPLVPSINNKYSEWQSANMTNIGFADFGCMEVDNVLYLTLEKPNLFKGFNNITESYMFFINDITISTGYNLGYDTYEYYIDIYGFNDSIVGSKGYQFDETKNQSDWNGFNSRYSSWDIIKANNQNQMEFSVFPVQMGNSNLSQLEIIIYHFDTSGGYEFSQVLNLEVLCSQEMIEQEETRSEPKMQWYQIFSENELHISMSDSLAYSNIPYNIRIMDKPQPTIEQPPVEINPDKTNKEPPSETINSNPPHTIRNMTITFTIDYDFFADDLITTCGGFIYISTANVSLDNSELVIYQNNKTVNNIKVAGDFGEKYIAEETSRSEYIKLDINSIPIINDKNIEDPIKPAQTIGTTTDLEARPTALNHDGGMTIDGFSPYNSHEEWFPSEYYYSNFVRDLDTGVQMDETYLYIYLRAETDGEDDTQDYGEVAFDLWDNGNTSPNNATYKKMRIASDNTTTYYEGSGSGWASTTLPTGWSGKSAYASGSGVYQGFEFKIPISDLNVSGRWDGHGEMIGFGTKIYDYVGGGNDYWVFYPPEYSLDTTSNDKLDEPDEWGDLEYTNYSIESGSIDSATPTVDGVVNETLWTSDASLTKVSDGGITMSVYHILNDTYLWVGITVNDDYSNEAGDFCQLFFCPENTADLYTDEDEIGWSITGTNATTYYYGTGSGWQSLTPIPTGWDAKTSYTNGTVSYEFRCAMSNLTAYGNFNDTGDTILHMIMATDTGNFTLQYPTYLGGSHDMRYDSHAWIDLMRMLHIPEFNDVAIPIFSIGFMVVLIIQRRSRIEYNRSEGGDCNE